MKKEVEIKSGLEIHQQLDTGKLFCSCPGILRKDEPDYAINRKLHLVAGEEGETDVAAEFEAGKEKEFIYQGYYDNCCLVELDEEPPHQINQEALEIAVQVSLLLNCEILPNTQIMRKTVIDGSNVSGFQRTVLIAKNGWVDTEKGRIGIQSVCLEEDAARIVEEKDGKRVYRLDRLGIPLIEIATEPDIKTGEQAKEVALKLGEILRVCKVKRGIGTIRQDVNMSVSVSGKWGERIEIKGVQEPKLIEKTIETEVKRQKKLIGQGKSRAEVRKALPNGNTSFLRPLPGRARMYPETDLPLLHISRELITKAKRKLPKLRTEVRKDLSRQGLNEEMIKLLLKQNLLGEFKELLQIYNNPNLVAKILVLWPKEIARHSKKNLREIKKRLGLDVVEGILQKLQKEEIEEGNVKKIIEELAMGRSFKEAVKIEKIENLEEEILKIIKEKPGLSINAYMGLVMKKFKGKVSGKKVMETLKKLIE